MRAMRKSLYLLFISTRLLQVIHAGLLVASALLGWQVLGALLSQPASLALGARLRFLLVDVVVDASTCLDVVGCRVVAKARVRGDLLGRRLFFAVHLVNVDRLNALVHDVVVLVISPLLGENVLDVVCVHG